MKQLTGLSYSVVYEGLLKLSERGVLVRKRVGNVNVYSFNKTGEAGRNQMVALAAGRREVFYRVHKQVGGWIKKLVERVKEELPSIYSIVLFGSYAKEKVRAESDIDVLFIISTEGDIKEKGMIISDICSTKSLESGKTINPVTVSLAEFEKMLKSIEHTLAHEVLLSSTPLHGSENYFDCIFGCLKWKELRI